MAAPSAVEGLDATIKLKEAMDNWLRLFNDNQLTRADKVAIARSESLKKIHWVAVNMRRYLEDKGERL